MNEIEIKYENNQMLVSSLQVAKDFGKEHRHVLESIRNLAAENSAAKSMFFESAYENRGKQYPMFLMNRDGFSLLAMGFTGKEALDWKVKYINAFNQMENKLNDPEFLLKKSMDYLQAKCNLLLEENTVLKPKALFADAVSASKSSILVGELAKIIKQNGHDIGQNRLFACLRENGYLISRKGSDYNMPTQKSMELGLFEIKEGTFVHSDGHTSITKTPKVTGKGQIYFVNKFANGELK